MENILILEFQILNTLKNDTWKGTCMRSCLLLNLSSPGYSIKGMQVITLEKLKNFLSCIYDSSWNPGSTQSSLTYPDSVATFSPSTP